MDNRTVKKYVRLGKEKREMEDKMRKLKEKIAETETRLLLQFEKAGVDSVKVDGMTLYLRHDSYPTAKDGDRAAVIAALKTCGLEAMLTFNSRSLKSLIKEWEDAGQEIPAPLKEVLTFTEKFSLLMRKSA